MADPLTDEIRDALVRSAVMAQERLSLRGHALYCAAMTFAERGERVSSADVLIRADLFLEWIEKPEPGQRRERSDPPKALKIFDWRPLMNITGEMVDAYERVFQTTPFDASDALNRVRAGLAAAAPLIAAQALRSVHAEITTRPGLADVADLIDQRADEYLA